MSDPITRLGAEQLALEISAQLEATAGCRPILAMLIKARGEAAEALTALAITPLETKEHAATARELQNAVKQYDNLVRWTKELLSEGAFERQEIGAQARESIRDILHYGPKEVVDEAEELGLTPGEVNDA